MKRLATLATIALLILPALALAKDYKVDIADVKYSPAKLKIKKGDKVIWTNSDDRDHTVVCKTKDREKDKEKTFDSGKIAAGDKFEFTFKKAGKYEYGCDYHPRMKGVVEVAD